MKIGTADPAKMTPEEVRAEIAELTPVLRKAYEQMGPSYDTGQISIVEDVPDGKTKTEWVQEGTERLTALGTRQLELDRAANGEKAVASAEEWLERPAGSPIVPTGKELQDFASLAMKSDAITGYQGGTGPESELAVDPKDFLQKTVMSTGAGFAPQAIRTGETPFAPFQEPEVIDLIPLRTTSQNAYVFMRQTTRTNNAAEIAESTDGSLQSLAESAFAWTEVSETIRKIGHFVPVTDEQLEDIEGMEDLLRQDMLSGVRERASSQILNGNGTAPNIEGFYDAGRTGVNQHDATGEAIAVGVAGGIEDCQITGFANPDGIILHPTDWWSHKTAQAADGVFLHGGPSENLAKMMWGLPVVVTTESAQGTGLVGAFARYSRFAVKRGVTVQISSEHASYFIQGVKAVKAEMRATLAVLREEAFAEITNLA